MLGLRVGDIIASEKDVRESLLVYVQGKPKFLASPGKYKGRKAIQIQAGYQPHNIRVELPTTPTGGRRSGLPHSAADGFGWFGDAASSGYI